VVATFYADDLEPLALQGPYELLAREAGQSGHWDTLMR
jgi:hypothetical protein